VRPLLEKAKQKAITANPDVADEDMEEEVKATPAPASKKVGIRGGAAAANTTTRNTTKLAPGKALASARDEEEKKASPAKAPGASASRRTVAPSKGPTLKPEF